MLNYSWKPWSGVAGLILGMAAMVFGIPAGAGESKKADNAPVFPELPLYPAQTAVQALPFRGVVPEGFPKGEWSLTNAPEGMVVNAETGQASWNKPVYWTHFIRMSLDTKKKGEAPIEVSWTLTVRWGGPLVGMNRGRYVDLWFNTTSMQTIAEQQNRIGVLDNVYAELCRRFGLPSLAPVAKIGLLVGWNGHWGYENPRNYDYTWRDIPHLDEKYPGLFPAIAELSRLAHGFALAPTNGACPSSSQETEHHLADWTTTALLFDMAERPGDYGLEGDDAKAYEEFFTKWRKDIVARGVAYKEWVKEGKPPFDYEGEAPPCCFNLAIELCSDHGAEAVFEALGLFRPYGLSREHRERAVNRSGKAALIARALSETTGADKRDFLKDWGWKIDDDLYKKMDKPVKDALARVKKTVVREGWVQYPGNKKWYRLTPTYISAKSAFDLGRLSPDIVCGAPRDAKENKWIVDTFCLYRGAEQNGLFIGLSDEEKEGVWLRSEGGKQSYFTWNANEPNNAWGKEDYSEILVGSSVHQERYRWIDISAQTFSSALLEGKPKRRR